MGANLRVSRAVAPHHPRVGASPQGRGKPCPYYTRAWRSPWPP